MSDYFLGEIRLFGCSYAPQGWSFCAGQTLPVAQNQALYSVIGTQFGGNPPTNFNLPDLRSRTPINPNQNGLNAKGITTGAQGLAGAAGTESVLLTAATMPAHTHPAYAADIPGTKAKPATGSPLVGNSLAIPAVATAPAVVAIYASAAAGTTTALDPTAVSSAGGGTAHDNRQPYIALNYCISLSGLYPTPAE